MKPSRRTAPLICALFGTQALATTNTLEHDVACAEIRFSESAEQKDLPAFRAALHPDAYFVGGDAPLIGAEVIADAWGRSFFGHDSNTIRWRPRFVSVREDGRFALSTGPYRIESPSGDLISWGKFSSNWLHQSEGWRVLFDNGFPGSGDMPVDDQALFDQDWSCDT